MIHISRQEDHEVGRAFATRRMNPADEPYSRDSRLRDSSTRCPVGKELKRELHSLVNMISRSEYGSDQRVKGDKQKWRSDITIYLIHPSIYRRTSVQRLLLFEYY